MSANPTASFPTYCLPLRPTSIRDASTEENEVHFVSSPFIWKSNQHLLFVMGVIPARKAVAFMAKAGQDVKVINTFGKQVVDFWAFNPNDPNDFNDFNDQ